MIVMDYHAILLQLGIAPNYKGYHQMLTALEIVEANPESLTMVTKWLYPAVAKWAYPEFCVTAKMRCKIELIFQGGSGVGCARLVYNITPTGAEVKGRPRSLEPRRRRSAP